MRHTSIAVFDSSIIGGLFCGPSGRLFPELIRALAQLGSRTDANCSSHRIDRCVLLLSRGLGRRLEDSEDLDEIVEDSPPAPALLADKAS